MKLAESFGAKGIRATKESELDGALQEMLESDVMTIFDCCVTKDENCFPMIPSGKPHYDMLLPGSSQEKVAAAIQGEGLALV